MIPFPMKLRLSALAAATVLAIAVPGTYASGSGLQSAMNGMFNSMVNVTSPKAYQTQRRGVISGGQVTVKNRIVNTSIVSFTPPSISAGCGGIDFFGGSFSFINADQFVQLMRAVASNAAGYIFQLALANTCAQCKSIIDGLQRIMTAINNAAGNSCQLAQGLVNDTIGGFFENGKTDASLVKTAQGIADDFASTWKRIGSTDQKGSYSGLDANTLSEHQLVGNVVYVAIQKSNMASAMKTAGLLGSSDDKTAASVIQSLTGSVILSAPEGGFSEDNPDPNMDVVGGTLKLTDLLNGGTVTLAACQNDDCSKVSYQDSTLTPISKKINDLLTGGSSGQGIIYKYAHAGASGLSMSASEKALLEVIPPVIGAQLQQLSVVAGEATALSFSEGISKAIALEMARKFTEELFNLTYNAVAVTKFAMRETVLEGIRDTQQMAHDDYIAYTEANDTNKDIPQKLAVILQIAKKAQAFWNANKATGVGGGV